MSAISGVGGVSAVGELGGGGAVGGLGGGDRVRRVGTVVSFDPVVGLGAIQAGEDGVVYPFHCTQIADGSRTAEVGAEMTFFVVAGRLGRWEAAGVGPAGAS